MKKIVITGGCGFIGSHLVDFFIEKEYRVIVIDNLASGNIQNIEKHINNNKLEFHKLDIANYKNNKNLNKILKGVHWLFHLAALADIVPSINHPLTYHQSNVDGTINILEASRYNKVKKFVYTASSSCYGIPDIYPTPETAKISPQYPYALTKYLGEQLAFHWHKVYHLPLISLRLFNVYGPRARTSGAYGAVFGVFLAQKLNHFPFTVVGDGSQTRDFTFVSDIVKAFYLAAKSSSDGEVFNIGSGNTSSINKLVKLLGGEVIYIPKRPGEPDCTFADINRARKILKYKPEVSFKEGVNIMLNNIEYWKDAPLWTPDKIEMATKEWFRSLQK